MGIASPKGVRVAEIGIKLADGTFYPIFDEGVTGRKRVVLQIANPAQRSVQVDLLRRTDGEVTHIGAVVLDRIEELDSDELELVLGSDGERVQARVTAADGRVEQVEAAVSDASADRRFEMPHDDLSIIDETVEIGPGLTDEPDDELDLSDLDDIGLPDMEEEPYDTGRLSRIEPVSMDDDSFDEPGGVDFGDDLEAPDSYDSDMDDDVDDLSVPAFDDIGSIPSYESDYDDTFVDADRTEEEPQEVAPRRMNAMALVALVLVVLSIALLGAWGVFSWLRGEPLPELRAALLLALPLLT